MAKLVVTRDTLVTMAQKCAASSARKGGTPLLDDAAELLEQAGFHVAALEDRLRRWEAFGQMVGQHMPKTDR